MHLFGELGCRHEFLLIYLATSGETLDTEVWKLYQHGQKYRDTAVFGYSSLASIAEGVGWVVLRAEFRRTVS